MKDLTTKKLSVIKETILTVSQAAQYHKLKAELRIWIYL